MKQKPTKVTDAAVLNMSDTYSLILFTLYKLKDVPEYSALSELAFVLDKKNLFKFCEFFGGLTIKVPTRLELVELTKALYIYQKIDIENCDVKATLNEFGYSISSFKASPLKKLYDEVRELMQQYNFVSADGRV